MNCPHCNELVDCHSPIDTEEKIVPQQDDISLCFYCGNFARFHNGELVKFTDAELKELKVNQPDVFEQLKLAQDILRELD